MFHLRLCNQPNTQVFDSDTYEMFFECGHLVTSNDTSAAAEIASGVAPGDVDASMTTAQAFSLSSRPGATKKIFLDFDGHVTTGSRWNTASGLAAITTPCYDKDGSPSTWSAAELNDIVWIWRAVSEDFSMFDVDVTTADPGAAVLGSGNAVRIAIGGSWQGEENMPGGGHHHHGSALFSCALLGHCLHPQHVSSCALC